MTPERTRPIIVHYRGLSISRSMLSCQRDHVEPAGVGQVEVFSCTIGFGPCATAEHVRAGEKTPGGIMVDRMTILLNTKRRSA